MSTRKIPLTLDQHRTIGAQLTDIRAALLTICAWIGRTYGLRSTVNLNRAIGGIERLKCTLDGAVYREFPEVPHPECTNIYYGKAPIDYTPRYADQVRVSEVCTELERRVEQLYAAAIPLYNGHPVALGDRFLRVARKLEIVFHNLPDWQPRQRLKVS